VRFLSPAAAAAAEQQIRCLRSENETAKFRSRDRVARSLPAKAFRRMVFYFRKPAILRLTSALLSSDKYDLFHSRLG
jgi:hypothetical protein